MNKNLRIQLAIVSGLLFTWLAIGGVRYFYFSGSEVHYHANFAVYINNERLTFENPFFYEEVGTSCVLSDDAKPEERAHLHDNVNSVIHVHDTLVTWQDFFNNIDYSISPLHIQTWDDVFVEDDSQKVTFILNGKAVNDITSLIINSEDTLLINYGTNQEVELIERAGAIENEAAEANTKPDPGACKGKESTATKLRRAFFFVG